METRKLKIITSDFKEKHFVSCLFFDKHTGTQKK
jgi:hypothetical protein